MTENKIHVNLGRRSYNIHIGGNTEKWSREFLDRVKPSASYIVTNDTIYIKQKNLVDALAKNLNAAVYSLPDGEDYKTVEEWGKLLSALLEKKFDRNMVLLALGGGVVGDMAGFAASAYRRGVSYIQIPTTLLAMVDSSVGGKTGVNHRLGKNMIGAFWQPAEVWIDISTLETLPEREYRAGMAELVKYAFIGGEDLYHWIKSNVNELLKRNTHVLTEGVARSCRFKADVVEKDERESGLRAVLNYGHTFAHAIETTAGYGKLLHGEAVTYGMMAAAALSFSLGKIDSDFVKQHNKLCMELNPPELPPLQVKNLIEAMLHDKKVQGKKQKFVITNGSGSVEVVENIGREYIEKAWKSILNKNDKDVI